MPDNKNKGIGSYKDRPGYFWGGLVGGAILGALVNKMQGKDWKRGAIYGGITGGLGSAFVGAGSTTAGTGWLDKMAPGMMKSMFTMGSGNPALFGTLAGGGGAWMAGDPKKDQSKYEAWKDEKEEERRKKQEEAYKYWHANPWATGGMVTSRPGYPGGGLATLDYSDPDLYTPTGEGGGPSSRPILQIPLGPEGSFAEEFEDLDLAGGPGAGDLSGWYEMYDDLKSKGELPDWMDSFEVFMQNLDALDISPTDFSARGGYKTRPGYRHAGEVRMDEEEKKRKMMEMIMMAAKLKQPTGELQQDTIDRSEEELNFLGAFSGSERRSDYIKDMMNARAKEMVGSEDWEGSLHPEQRAELEDYFARYNPMAYRAEGGITDLDMTKGGASTGPGTGTSDDIPAMLSDGEFVVTANAVKNLGGGDRMEGAKRMYSMMNQLDPNSQTPAEMSAVGRT